MSREIKFRAWDRQTKEMIPWNNMYGLANMETGLGVHLAVADQCYLDEVDLMQYTGLRDKNGKEIYEGDVLAQNPRKYHVQAHGEYDSAFVVEWSTINGGDDADPQSHGYHFDPSSLEVIGNIYENSELLEG